MADGNVGNTILAERIERIGSDVAEIKEQMQRLAGDMERIARLEERHANSGEAIARAFARIEQHEQRMIKLEVEAPMTQMVRNWVVTGVIGVVGLLGVQVFAVFFYAAKFVPK